MFEVFLCKQFTYVIFTCIMKGEISVKTSELIKLLKRNGVFLLKHGRNHDIYYSPLTQKEFPIPRHKGEVSTGTCEAILKQAGIKQDLQKGEKG